MTIDFLQFLLINNTDVKECYCELLEQIESALSFQYMYIITGDDLSLVLDQDLDTMSYKKEKIQNLDNRF